MKLIHLPTLIHTYLWRLKVHSVSWKTYDKVFLILDGQAARCCEFHVFQSTRNNDTEHLLLTTCVRACVRAWCVYIYIYIYIYILHKPHARARAQTNTHTHTHTHTHSHTQVVSKKDTHIITLRWKLQAHWRVQPYCSVQFNL